MNRCSMKSSGMNGNSIGIQDSLDFYVAVFLCSEILPVNVKYKFHRTGAFMF